MNYSAIIPKRVIIMLETKEVLIMQKITVKEYLENIIKILNEITNKEYEIKCFEYPIDYDIDGTRKDLALGSNTKQEGVIALTPKGYDTKKIFQGYLCYPDKYQDFYKLGNFILCYGPSAETLNSSQVLQRKVSDMNLFASFYGLPTSVTNILKYNNIMQRYRNEEFGEDFLTLYEILEKAGSPDLLDTFNKEELDYLINHSTGFTKMMFSEIKKKRFNDNMTLSLNKKN